MRAIPKRLGSVFTTRRYTSPCFSLRYHYDAATLLVICLLLKEFAEEQSAC